MILSFYVLFVWAVLSNPTLRQKEDHRLVVFSASCERFPVLISFSFTVLADCA